MASIPSEYPVTRQRRGLGDRLGDHGLKAITLAAALSAVVLLGAIVWKVMELAWPAISHYGLSFLTSATWDPVRKEFGALSFIYGTAVSSFLALLIATPLAVAIALWLSELAPRGVRGVIGSLVEMLAAIPSVVLGLWGILVLGPVVHDTLGPWLNDVFGWTPFFSSLPASGSTVFTAVLVLTIMIIPITASISRDLFQQVPPDIKEGAYGLGLTRWEMMRGVLL